VVPAAFTTLTDTVPVVMPRKEKPLNPGDRVCVPSVVLPLVTIADKPVWPLATRMPACEKCESLGESKKIGGIP